MDQRGTDPQIIEDRLHGDVLVDGVRVWGFVDVNKSACGHVRIYSERYDAYFCARDNRWDTENCGDPTCKPCTLRPDPPMSDPLDVPPDPSAYR